MHPIATVRDWSRAEHHFTRWEKFVILMFLCTCGGIFGFLYETLFYRIDLGYFVKRGTTLGPWIPIYAYGSFFILLFAYRFRRHPLAVFLLGTVSSGVLEYAVGWFLWTRLHTRLWDYNTEIWNWGNINGYICARSVLFFGLSGLFLVYLLVPVATHLAGTMKKRTFALMSLIPAGLFILDIVYSFIR